MKKEKVTSITKKTKEKEESKKKEKEITKKAKDKVKEKVKKPVEPEEEEELEELDEEDLDLAGLDDASEEEDEEEEEKEPDITTRSFQVDASINRFKLDEENEKQASLYHYWSDLCADAKADRDTMEDALDLIISKTDDAIRKNAQRNDEKVTEPAIKNLIERDKFVANAKEDLRKAKSDVYHLEAAVKALEHRKGSLDNLTILWTKNYYSQPSGIVSTDTSTTVTDAVSKDLRANLNKKKKEKRGK